MKNVSPLLALVLASCSGRLPVRTNDAEVGAGISVSDRAAIIARVGNLGAGEEIGEIKRLSVDTFCVDVGGVPHIVSLRDDGIVTEGGLSASEIEAIKRMANSARRLKEFSISSIKQTGTDSVEVMTGDFGTATGEILIFERANGTWRLTSASLWVE